MIQIDYLADELQHVPELARLHLEQWGALAPEETLAARISRLRGLCGKRAIPAAFVARHGEDLVGSALLVAHDMKSRMELTPWLAGVYVKADWRRQGVASRLIRRVEQEAAALRVADLHLFTDAEEAFYASRGWRLLERTLYRGLQVSVMRKAMELPATAGA